MYAKYEVDGANSLEKTSGNQEVHRRKDTHYKGTKAKTESPSGVPPGGAQ